MLFPLLGSMNWLRHRSEIYAASTSINNASTSGVGASQSFGPFYEISAMVL